VVKKLVVAVVIVIVAVGVGMRLFGSSREAEVKKQLSSLSDLIEKTPDEKNVTTLLKANRVSDLFDQKCSLTMSGNPLSGTYSPSEMRALALRLRSGFTRVAVTFHDPDITFPDDQTAEVLMVTKVKGETASGKADEILETKCRLRHVEDSWRFAEFKVVESLQK